MGNRLPSAAMPATRPLLTTYGVADLLGITPRRVGRMVRDGRLPYVEIDGAIRFDPEDVGEFITAHKKLPAASRPEFEMEETEP